MNTMTQMDDHRRVSDRTFTVLCIDDEIVNLKVLASIFKENYQVVICKNARQGFDKALEIIPELILLDVLMPEETGFELIKKLKDHAALKHIPVIFITGLQNSDDEERGLTLGACDYIHKPFNPGIVRARVNTHMEIVRQRNLLERFAHFDSLTELPNRRKWDQDSNVHWQQALKNNAHIVYGIVDIDFFKFYNDLYGHQQGDIVLRKVSNTIRRVLFEHHGDLYRCGGEEFYFYLNKKSSLCCQQILQQCINSVTALEISHENSPICAYISVSIGAVKLQATQDLQLNEVMGIADKELYHVKNSTRNAVRFLNLTNTP